MHHKGRAQINSPSIDHFSKYTADAPNIYGGAIFPASHQYVGGAIPQGHHLVRIGSDRNAKRSGESKISKFQLPFAIDEQVWRFQIAMQHPMVVAVGHASQQLEEKALQYR